MTLSFSGESKGPKITVLDNEGDLITVAHQVISLIPAASQRPGPPVCWQSVPGVSTGTQRSSSKYGASDIS